MPGRGKSKELIQIVQFNMHCNKLYLINTIATIPTTTRMIMMMMTNTATITPKMVAISPLEGGGSVCSWVVVPPVGLSGVVGLVVGGCVTTTPVKESKVLLGHCYWHQEVRMFQPNGAGSVLSPSNSCPLRLKVTASENR